MRVRLALSFLACEDRIRVRLFQVCVSLFPWLASRDVWQGGMDGTQGSQIAGR